MLPSITPEVIQKRMSVCWADANFTNRLELYAMAKAYMDEYNWLSNYMTQDRVDAILTSCEENT